MSIVNATIVGLGWWGRELVAATCRPDTRLRFLRAVDTLAPSDRRESVSAANASAERFASDHGLTLHTCLDEILNDDEVEAVVLATPHSLHVDQIVQCAEAGKPVYSEKPLALRLEDAQRAVEACRDNGVVLGLGTDKRFLPAVRRLGELVRNGALGDILHVEAQYSNANSLTGVLSGWRALPSEAPGLGMTGPGLHALDATVSIIGPVDVVHAEQHIASPMPHAVDAVSVTMRSSAGPTAAVTTIRGVPDQFRLQVAGTGGWAEVRDFGTLHLAPLDGPRSETHFDQGLATGYLLDEFAAAVRGRRDFPVSVRSMLDTVAAFEAVIESLETGRTVRAPAVVA